MKIWNAIRRFSGIGKRVRADHAVHRAGKRQSPALRSLINRGLRMEQFEERMLLSISPANLGELWEVNAELARSIENAVNLDGYTDEELSSTTQWVVGLSSEDESSNFHAMAANADFLTETLCLPNAAIWQFNSSLDWNTVVDTLECDGDIDYYYPLVLQKDNATLMIPNDPLFPEQWNLNNTGQSGGLPGADSNVVSAWDDVLGTGVVVAIVDDGLQYTHPDLGTNYRSDLSWDYGQNDPDPMPVYDNEYFDGYLIQYGDNHGTAVAGLVGATGNNNEGVSGHAPDSDLVGIRIDYTMGWTDYTEGLFLSHENQSIDVYNNSWGSTGLFDEVGPFTLAALQDSVINGRDGLGNIYVFSAGNGRQDIGQNVNHHGIQSLRYTIAVACLTDMGTYASYSAPGSSLMISTYADGVYSTDRTDEGYVDGDYDPGFNGTSAAAPSLSGIVALMLDANPNLGYRDVQHILAETAAMNDPSNSDWQVNSAGYHVNHNYGFGAADAAAAVDLAYNWQNVTEERSVSSGIIQVNQAIPDNSIYGVTSSVTMDDSIDEVEWVELTVDIDHAYGTNMEIILTSPSGTQSRMLEATTADNYQIGSNPLQGRTLTSCFNWGESSEGEWTVEVRDRITGATGTLNNFELTIYGTKESNEPIDPVQPDIEVGLNLVSVIPNSGDPITEGSIQHVAPRELVLVFNEGQEIDPDTLGAISMKRAGGDDVFLNLNDETVEFGYIGIGDRPNEVVIRFAETLPDDLYELTILGSGDTPLATLSDVPFSEGEDSTIEFSLDLGAQVTAIVPQPVTRDADGGISQSRNTIEIYFNNDTLDQTSAENAEFYTLFVTNETETNEDDVVILPNSVTYDPIANKAVLTFEDDLASYGTGAFRLRIGDEYERIRQPIAILEFSGDNNDILLIAAVAGAECNGIDISIVNNIASGDEAIVTFNPSTKSYRIDVDPQATTAQTVREAINNEGTFIAEYDFTNDTNNDGSGLVDVEPGLIATIGPISEELVADVFSDATPITGLVNIDTETSVTVSSIIEPQPYDITFPGSINEQGHRNLPTASETEGHYVGGANYVDTEYGTSTIYYNFNQYLDPDGIYFNQISEIQKQRAREIFELYSTYLGINFIEDTSQDGQGITVATGDMHAVSPNVSTGEGGVISISAYDEITVMDMAEDWNNEYNGSWFNAAMCGIGHTLGLGYSYDLPGYSLTGNTGPTGGEYYAATAETMYPGLADVIHGLYLHRSDSIDVDVFSFTIDTAGTVSAEIFAERLEDSSLLDSVITIYDEDHNLIARNDDYYSEDSFVELTLGAGTYYVAVSSTGNTEFDPNVPCSGEGGTSQGEYDLRVTFLPKLIPGEATPGPLDTLIDGTGTMFDGDADGIQGGEYNFWFDVQTQDDTIFVDKTAADYADSNEPLGSEDNPYTQIDQALQNADEGQIVRIIGNRVQDFNSAITVDTFDAPQDAAVGDFNNDGIPDLVTIAEDDDEFFVQVFFGINGEEYWTPISYAVGENPSEIKVADLNNDGAEDLVVTNSGEATLSLLMNLNDGSGNFAPHTTRFTGNNPTSLELSDLNGDGRVDLIVTNEDDNTIGVLLSNSVSFFADQVAYHVGDGAHPVDVTAGDINNDGMVDIVSVNQGDQSISILLNMGEDPDTGETTFEKKGDNIIIGGTLTAGILADLDEDGTNDLILVDADENNEQLVVKMGSGNGSFGLPAYLDVGTNPGDIAVGDSDGDGHIEIFALNQGTDTEDGSVSVFFGKDGRFVIDEGTDPSTDDDKLDINEIIEKDYVVGKNASGMTIADTDRNGRPDIVISNEKDETLSILTVQRDQAYEIGFDIYGTTLEDGRRMEIPKDVTVMIDAGSVFKLREANIDVGSSSQGVDRSEGALQVLGTPQTSVYFTSYYDKTLGTIDYEATLADKATPGDWGGLVFRSDIDYDDERIVLEAEGIFLNYVNNAEFYYGGGQVTVNSVRDVYTPIHMIESRPTIAFNEIYHSADAAMSADPGSFADTRFQGDTFTSDYDRVGPAIHGNLVLDNSLNGLYVRIETLAGNVLENLEICGRFDDTDIVHILSENFIVGSSPGGPELRADGSYEARTDGRLTIDPGIIVKLNRSRIETELGAQLIAEGTAELPIIFTSYLDTRYGAGGTFDTTDTVGQYTPEPGNWSGLYFGATSTASLDNTVIAYAGGTSRVQGGFAEFNAVESHQATLRLTNSKLEFNNGITTDDNRVGRESTDASVIYVKGAQPILTNNVILNNDAPAISINANSLIDDAVVDWGRSTGRLDAFEEYAGNSGPMVRANRLYNNDINGMVVRGEVLSTASVWDDTDMVHVLTDEIVCTNFHTEGGLRLESAAEESLVVKLYGNDAGFTALGTPSEIDDRIGGTLQILGMPGFPVILTSLRDDTVGAGVDPWGSSLLDTDNLDAEAGSGDWRSVKLEEYVNDRNVAVVNEVELAYGLGSGTNDTALEAQYLGLLAPDQKSGDDNLRLGFDVHGFIQMDDTTDADVYAFTGIAGSEVWIDIDSTTLGLNSVVELIDADGNVLARSVNSAQEDLGQLIREDLIDADENLSGGENLAMSMDRDIWNINDQYTTNLNDAGMRVVLPGEENETLVYYVRVSSFDEALANDPNGDQGDSRGGYDLQIRLQEAQEIAGSTVQQSSIRYASIGIELLGLPANSPLTVDAAETDTQNDTFETAQDLGNLLVTDMGQLEVAGNIESKDDVDWYSFTIQLEGIDEINGVSTKLIQWPTIFDIDYADGMGRPDLVLYVFDSTGTLVYYGDDSNVSDDQPDPENAPSMDDLLRGSFGTADPFIGPVNLLTSATDRYYVAVANRAMVPEALSDENTRVEPINSINRVAEDQITADEESNVANEAYYSLFNTQNLDLNINDYTLNDVVLYVCSGGELYTVNPYTGQVQTDVTGVNDKLSGNYGDIVMRDDGRLYSLTSNQGTTDPDAIGTYAQFSTEDGSILSQQDDGIVIYQIITEGEEITVEEVTTGGIHFYAMAYIPENRLGSFNVAGGQKLKLGSYIAVGCHESGDGGVYTQNLLYVFDENGVAVQPAIAADVSGEVLPSNVIPWSQLDTTPYSIDPENPFPAVTGLTFVGTDLYACDDAGNMYSVENYFAQDFIAFEPDDEDPDPTTRIEPAVPKLLTVDLINANPDVSYTGLDQGPVNAEGSLYTNALFATAKNADDDVLLCAIDITGHQIPVFANGESSIVVQCPANHPGLTIGDTTGLAFSTLDYNLWHVTDNRGHGNLENGDDGHGTTVAPDKTRQEPSKDIYPIIGDSNDPGDNVSFWFGYEEEHFPNYDEYAGIDSGALENTDVLSSYALPGGAHGTLTTNTFSLAGYSEDDLPVLTFNYFLETDGDAGNPATDTARVFISDDGANWTLLASNTENTDDDKDDDEVPEPSYDVVQMVDGSGIWNQCVIDLKDCIADLSDLNHLQLKFEFTTAGNMGTGDQDQNGLYENAFLKTVAGDQIKDGENGTSIQLYNGDELAEFTYSLGYSLVLPNSAGQAINEGDSVTIGSHTFEFSRSSTAVYDPSGTYHVIPINESDATTPLAEKLETILNDLFQNPYYAYTVGNSIYLPYAQTASVQLADPGNETLIIEGNAGVGIIPLPGDSIEAVAASFSTLDASTIEGIFNTLDETVIDQIAVSLGVPDAVLELLDKDTKVDYLTNGFSLMGYEFDGLVAASNTEIQYFFDETISSSVYQAIKELVPLDLPTTPAPSSDTVIPIGPWWTAEEVAYKTAQVINARFLQEACSSDFVPEGEEFLSTLKRDGSLITMANYQIINPGPHGTNSGQQPGDTQDVSENITDPKGTHYYDNLQGQDNVYEGFYIDDVIIGFAERGMMVTNAPENATFVAVPDNELEYPYDYNPDPTLTGDYQLTIRSASEYTIGCPCGAPGVPERSLDTNDRNTQAITLLAPAAGDIASNDYFTISDGVHTKTFQFVAGELDSSTYDEIDGATRITFWADQSAEEIAYLIYNAINIDDTTEVTAGVLTGYSNWENGSNRVDLFHAASVDGIEYLLYGDHSQNIYQSAEEATLIAFEDVTNNGFNDIILVNAEEKTARIFHGEFHPDGTLTHTHRETIALGTEASDIDVADLNGDSFLDLVVSNYGDDTVTVYINGGAGYFNQPITISTGSEPTSLEIVNFNGNDDYPGLVVACEGDNQIQTYLGNGDGTFDLASIVNVGLAPKDLVIGDIDGNGKPDVVVANAGDNTISVLLGSGNGVFDEDLDPTTVGRMPVAIALDTSNDTDVPSIIAIANRGDNTVTVLQNVGGILTEATDANTYATGSDPVDIQIADITNDDIIDIATINYGDSTITTYMGLEEPGPDGELFDVSDQESNIGTFDTNGGPVSLVISNLGSNLLAAEEQVVLIADSIGQTISVFLGGGCAPYELAYDSYEQESSNLNELTGDTNHEREQGYVLISSNEILYANQYGIMSDAGTVDYATHPGAVAPLRQINTDQLVPGISIMNNLVVDAGSAGIFFSGSPTATENGNDTAIPFGRIVNNTVYGCQTGIMVTENASPTLLNNIVSENYNGIWVDYTCQSTVIGGTVYHENEQNVIGLGDLGDFAMVLDAEDPLFVDAKNNNFYLAEYSEAIDSAIDSLEERDSLADVTEPLGYAPSPILAPEYDLYGQQRSDDPYVTSQTGQGLSPFKDRGAIDRIDFTAPTSSLIDPMDNDSMGIDRDEHVNDVFIAYERLSVFGIQLSDPVGVGIDDNTVVSAAVKIYQDDNVQPLAAGVDYFFRYDSTTNVIRLYSGTGFWDSGSTYKIVLDNSADGIADIAGNPIRANRYDGSTYFNVSMASFDYGDAPEGDIDGDGIVDMNYPTLLGDTTEPDQGGARHLQIGNYYLGAGVTGEDDANFFYDEDTGELITDAQGDAGDDGVTFSNSAIMIGDEAVTITVTASRDDGYLNAWIDFNGDGDWDDVGEKLLFNVDTNNDGVIDGTVDSYLLDKGENTLTFNIPNSDQIDAKETYARFRYSSEQNLGTGGEAPDGEVEDYQIFLADELLDYGDAPNSIDNQPTSYDTSTTYHKTGGTLFLGSSVDNELKGQPHPNALGDDQIGTYDEEHDIVINDEDGIEFDGYLQPGKTVDIIVTSSGTGYLNAWMDYNGDGDWDDPEEQILNLKEVTEGVNTFTITIPESAAIGTTFARFRLFSDETWTVESTGRATDSQSEVITPDGEVEDYAVMVTAQPRDFGDAPRSYYTRATSEAATALMQFPGKNNDISLTAAIAGMEYNDINISIVNEIAYGNVARVTYNAVTNSYLIDVDPEATTADAVIKAINKEGTFIAVRDVTSDINNDGSGLISVPPGLVTTTSGGYDGLGEEAATHDLGSGLKLGTRIDAEFNANASDDATGDDQHGSDDEDGINDPSLVQFVAGQQATLDYTVTIPEGMDTAYLSAWIDFNQDGVFSEEEQVLIDTLITKESSDIITGTATVTIPIEALSGETFARFRLSSQEGIDWYGSAPDGEIEDYKIEILKGDATISGYAFRDRNFNKVWDDDEKGQVGVVVYIDLVDLDRDKDEEFDYEDVNGSGKFEPGIDFAYEPYAVTMDDDLSTLDGDETGYYEFSGLFGQVEPYIVRQITPNDSLLTFPQEQVFLPDGSYGSGGSYSIFLEDGELVANANFGNFEKAHVTIEDVIVTEGNVGYTDIDVVVTLSHSFGADLTFSYRTEDGSATTANNDYVPKNGVFTFDEQEVPVATWTTSILTTTETNDYDYSADGSFVIWEGYDGHDWEIYLFAGEYDAEDKPVIHQLSDNTTPDRGATVFASQNIDGTFDVMVAWTGETDDGDDTEIFVYNATFNGDGTINGEGRTATLTDNAFDDQAPQISDTYITWWGDDGRSTEIFYYDISEISYDQEEDSPKNLTENDHLDQAPIIQESNIVWIGDMGRGNELFLFTGEYDEYDNPIITQITNNYSDDKEPQIDGNNIIWQGYRGSAYQIFLYQIDTGLTTQITSAGADNLYPQISGSDIVWQSRQGSDWEIFHYNIEAATNPVNISNDYYQRDEHPEIINEMIVWRSFNGEGYETYYHKLRGDGSIVSISDPEASAWYPHITEDVAVWRSDNGTNYDIVVARQDLPETTQTIKLRVIGDMANEFDETFFLNLQAMVDNDWVTFEDAQATITILNDDGKIDFGDAPDSYSTSLSENGARHLESTEFTAILGTEIDYEEDGQPSETSSGDDTLYNDDEDGVTFQAIGQGTQTTIKVHVGDLAENEYAYLDAWIDFKQEGNWDGLSDKIFNAYPVHGGDNYLTFTVPEDALPGLTHARFRLSNIGGLDYTGQVKGGEVEDYQIEIIAKPVVEDNIVNLYGTDGNDEFLFFAGNTLEVIVNNVSYYFDPTEVDQILFDGGAGNDSVVFYSSTEKEMVNMWSNRALFNGPDMDPNPETYLPQYLVDTNNVETVHAFAGNAEDVVTMTGSLGDDLFTSNPQTKTAILSGDTFTLEATNFFTVDAFGAGGDDMAKLNGSAGNDTYTASPDTAQMVSAGVTTIADDFRYVTAYAGEGGSDEAILRDSEGLDTFTFSADPEYLANIEDFEGNPVTMLSMGNLANEAFGLTAFNFSYIKAISQSGEDKAHMVGSPSKDVFTGNPMGIGSYAKLQSVVEAGSGLFDYDCIAEGFRYVTATSVENTNSAPSNNDFATLEGSSGSDVFTATPSYSKMSGKGYYCRVDAFPRVTAEGDLDHDDAAFLYDSPGNDTFYGYQTFGQMTSDDLSYQIMANNFKHLTAMGGSGGEDYAELYGSLGDDQYIATVDFAKMNRNGHDSYYRAISFQTIVAYGVNGENDHDIAELYDTIYADELIATGSLATDDTYAKITYKEYDFYREINEFHEVTCESSNRGDKKEVEASVDFLLAEGFWEDDDLF